jgi:hypothetical protein
LICYWGAHYICFFKEEVKKNIYSEDNQENTWICYNDNTVTRINSWKDLIIKSIKSHFHPTVLFYKKMKKKEKRFSLYDEVKEEISAPDMDNIMKYCINYDKQNEFLYSQNNNLSSRIRPLLLNKKPSDELTSSIILNSTRKMFEETNNDMVNNESSRKELNYNMSDKSIQDNNYNINEYNPDFKKEIVITEERKSPQLGEDEWLCVKCENINLNNLDTCLSKIIF